MSNKHSQLNSEDIELQHTNIRSRWSPFGGPSSSSERIQYEAVDSNAAYDEIQQTPADSTRDHNSYFDDSRISQVHLVSSETRANPDIHYGDPKKANGPSRIPLFLRSGTIIGFVIVYIVLLAALVFLQVFDKKHTGLTTTETNKQFLWTFGPTAVLAVVAAFWAQVEYRVKQQAPWEILRKGPTPAAKTLLMDYISPAQLYSLYHSIRHNQWLVFLTILASFQIKLLTIVSTALLMLQDDRITVHNLPLIATDKFDASTFSQAQTDFVPVLSTIALGNQNLSYGPGIAEKIAFPSLRVKDSRAGVEYSQIQSVVDTFEADLDCDEGGSLKAINTSCTSHGCEQLVTNFELQTPTCKSTIINETQHSPSYPLVFFGMASPIECTNLAADEDNHRLILAVGVVSTNATTSFFTNSVRVVSDSTTILTCKPKYTVQKSNVTVSDTGIIYDDKTNLGNAMNETTIQPVSSWDFFQAFESCIEKSITFVSGILKPIPPAKNVANSTTFDPFFQLIQATVDNLTVTQLQDSKFLQDQSTEIYRKISAQIAKSYLMVPAEDEVKGTCETTQQRLRVRGLSLYMMEAILCFLIIQTAVMAFLVNRLSRIRDYGSIARLATVMSRSTQLSETISGHGASRLPNLQSVLSPYRCVSQEDHRNNAPEFRIELLAEKGTASSATPRDGLTGAPKHAREWWRPFSKSWTFTIVVMVMTLLVIIGLEVSFWKSEKSKGLADVDQSGYIRYTWSYVPALVMVSIQLLVGTIGFSSLSILPYYRLRTLGNCGRQDILKDHLSRLNAHNIVESALRLQYLPFVISLSLFLSAFLTIVVSGLYSPQQVDLRQTVPINMDDYNVNASLIQIAAKEASLTNKYQTFPFLMGLLLRENFTFPPWTYEGLMIPQLALASNDTRVSSQETLEVDLPALRAVIECNKVSGDPWNVSGIGGPRWEDYNHTEPRCGNDFISTLGTLQDAPFGTFTPNKWGVGFLWSDRYDESDIRNTGCLTVGGTFGSSLSTYTNIICSTSLEQVTARTHFHLPTYSLINATADESTRTTVSKPDLRYYYDTGFDALLPAYQEAYSSDDLTFDVFFQNLLYGKDNATIASFLHPDNYDGVLTAIQSQYQLMMAQVLSDVFRPDPTTNWTATQYHSSANLTANKRLRTTTPSNATRVNPDRYRLHQSLLSTRILDALLAVIFVCVGASWWLMPMRRKDEILPKNPCSIAAAASLIAGSKMLAEVPPGAEWWSDRELEKRGVWEGRGFRMGWFEREEEGGGVVERFGVDVCAEDRLVGRRGSEERRDE